MRKAKSCAFLLTLVLALALLIMPFGWISVSAAEITDTQITATTSASVKQGNTGYCYVYIDSLESISTLSVTVHYDADKVKVESGYVYNTVSSLLNDKSVSESSVQFSYIFDGKGKAEKTQLFYFRYTVLSDAEVGNTYFDIVVNEAYDSSLQPITVNGSRCAFKVAETVTTKTCSIYSSSSVSTSVGEEFEISYRLSTYQIASGSFSINYDPELFEVVGVTNGAFCDNKIVDVNTGLSGSVYVSFVGTEYKNNTNLITVKFKTLKNVSEKSTIKMAVTEFYDLALNPISCSGYTTAANIAFDETYTEDAPSMTLQTAYNAATDKVTLTIKLDKDSKLGAGDFVLKFNTNYLIYSSAEKGFSPTFFNINDKNVSDGILKFSIISLSNITDEQIVLNVTFDVKHACEDKIADFEISGSGLTDALTNTIVLNFVDASVTVPFEHIDGNDNNHLCDKGCGTIADEVCYDDNTDHACDECGAIGMGEHSDGVDNNHLCDYGCGQVADDGCHDVNTDTNHRCDECGEDNVTAHIDGNDNNHLCDNGCGQIADDGCYDNDTNHACDECGKADIGTHADSDTDNDHVCDYGCGETLENCSGGTATCTTLAVCTICEKSYGDYAAHTFDAACDYKDASGHAHVCTVNGCGEHDEIQSHNPNIPAATEDEAQVCTDCGYQMAAQLNHTHNAESEWTSNTTHHWHDCTDCEGQELDKATHDDGNSDGRCDTCNYQMSTVDSGTDPAYPGTDTEPQPPVDPDEDDDGLGAGAISAIVISSVAVSGGGGFALFWFVIRKKRVL